MDPIEKNTPFAGDGQTTDYTPTNGEYKVTVRVCVRCNRMCYALQSTPNPVCALCDEEEHPHKED